VEPKIDLSLAHLLLPHGVLEYFNISKVEALENSYNIWLEEKIDPPEEYQDHKLTSKGFYDEITVQDFPLRGKAVYLRIKRRRWLNETTGKIVNRTWDLIAKGTRMTTEFAAFLKAIS
jgi:hypothetical protein